MKLDGAIFAIEQRSVGGCIDLAIAFYREHFLSILQLLVWFAVPSIALTWWLVSSESATLTEALLLFFVESPFFGAALVAASGHRAFGEPFSPWVGIKALWRRLFFFGVLVVIVKFLTFLGFFAFIFPAYLISTRYGFLSEILFLENCPARKYETRLSDLMNQNFKNLVGRLVYILFFFSSVMTSLFLLVDLGASTLFGMPVLFRRVSSIEYMADELLTLLTVDPLVAVVLVSLCWLVYPVARLAWMFCYLDVRIRNEGWDLEIDFRVEAQRLEGAT
ncbi:hypothetical protein [Thalassoglobus sp.]|uniref:hypothetical protein n=1 Tax=Thalassoglobus sp. TaxID=2795869 RepID=UPI003AA8CAA9